MARTGRRTAYTPETADRIIQAFRAGIKNDDTACAAAGIGRTTYYVWLNRHPDFRDRVEKAKAGREVRWLAIIGEAAGTSWQAAAWLLERTKPDEYGRVRIDHGGTVNHAHGGTVTHNHKTYDHSHLSLEDQFNLDQMLAAIVDGGDG